MRIPTSRPFVALALASLAPLAAQQFTIGGNGGTVIINGRRVGEDDGLPKGPVTARVFTDPANPKPGQPFVVRLKIDAGGGGFGGSAAPLKGPGDTTLALTGQSMNYSAINGATEASVNLAYEGVAPAAPGEYRIPAQTMMLGSRRVDVPETAMTVRALAEGEHAYTPVTATVEMPAGPFYVGQEIVATLVVTGSEDEEIRGVTGVTLGDDDSLAPIPNSQRRKSEIRTIGGKKIVVTSVTFRFSALTAGEKTAAANATVYVTPTGDDADAGPFGNRRDTVVRRIVAKPAKFTVVHAPVAGKPASFRGAIGDFSLDGPDLSATKGKAGEPLKLSFIVSGDYAPDRIVPPELKGDNWVVKQEEPVLGVDRSNRPAKQFQYSITPLYGGRQKTPSGELSWFDPVKKKYVVAPIAPVEVDIEGEPAPVLAEPAVAAAKEAPKLADDPAPSGRRVDYAPLRDSSSFVMPQLFAGLALAFAALVTGRARHFEKYPEKLRRKHARRDMRRAAARARRALARGDRAAYAEEARKALRAGAAPLAGARAAALTGEETLAALPEGADRAALRPLFASENAAKFSGEKTPPDTDDAAPALRVALALLDRSLR